MKLGKHKTHLLPLLGALLALAFVLTACGTKNNDKQVTNKPESSTEEENTELPFPEDGKLTVATYNIATGRQTGYYLPLFAEDIVNSGAQIVALQEVDQNTVRNSYQDTMTILSAETGMKYYKFAPALSPYQEGEYGIGILSYYPIISTEYHKLPMLSDEEEQRVILHAKIDVGGTELDFFVTHGQMVSIREQLTAANEYTSQCDSFVYAGDFNNYVFENFDLIENSYTVVNYENPLLTTENRSFDNIIISDNIKSENTRTINTEHSDHYMLLTDLILTQDK